jgi:cell division septation protein DedD
MNKVIVKGFSTRAEAKALAARQFPGAFIVAGSSSSGGSSYTPPPTSYTPQPSYTPPVGGGNSNSGIGVQIGAFSSKAKAREAAQSAAAGRYTAIVKTVNVRGKTLYKAILLGFNSRQEAKSAIASGEFGSAFVVSNIYP